MPMTYFQSSQPLPPACGNSALARLAEGPRYALLRRLAPAIRHDMAGSLQPISMVAAMLEKRLQKPDPDLLAMGRNVNAINALAREAAQSCMQLMTWLAPKADAPVAVGAGVAEAISLVATELAFKGFTLVNETESVAVMLPVSVLRGLFIGSVVAMTDHHTGPGRVVLQARSGDGDRDTLVLSVAFEPGDGQAMPGMPASYRRLEWADMHAIALAESVELVQTSHRVELRCAVP